MFGILITLFIFTDPVIFFRSCKICVLDFNNLIIFSGPVKSVFWILITLAAVGGLIYNAMMLFMTFFDYKVTVLVELRYQRELDFPAVTVCNMNPIKKRALGSIPEIRVYIRLMLPL